MIGLLRRLRASRPPEVERCVVSVAGREVDYELRRSARRTLGMRMDVSGLRVAVPWGVSLPEIEHFVLQHQDWLVKRLAERDEALALQAFAAADGACFPLFGEECVLHVGAEGARSRWLKADAGEVLQVGAKDPRSAVVRALRRRALPYFLGRVSEHCQRLGVAVPPVRLTSARTRWGSCSARSGIRLHWRLLHLPPQIIDYVVAHEVAHLVEMNHSPRFWRVVETLHPEWQSSRRQLHERARTLPIIQPGTGAAPQAED